MQIGLPFLPCIPIGSHLLYKPPKSVVRYRNPLAFLLLCNRYFYMYTDILLFKYNVVCGFQLFLILRSYNAMLGTAFLWI